MEMLTEPSQFFAEIKAMIASAKKTVHIAALYLGCTKMCKDLAESIESAMWANPDVHVTLLLDYGRSQRRERDGTTVMAVLTPVLQVFHGRLSVRLFMVPLCGAAFRHAPPAIREFAGVQHMKGCVADDDVMITGGNLSDDYFTDRQDRYMIMRGAPALADWVRQLFQRLADLAFDAAPNADGDVNPVWPCGEPHPVWSGPSPRTKHEFAESACGRVEEMLAREGDPLGESLKGDAPVDTFVWPLVQMAPLGVEHDAMVLPLVLSSLPGSYKGTICSAYPNFSPRLVQSIRDAPLPMQIVAPKEEASGFYGAGGAKEWVPRTYTALLRGVLSAAGARTTLRGWKRPGWTFHGKGIWALPDAKSQPAFMLLGSSNFGYRSEDLDLELGFAFITHNQGLQKQWVDELDNLLKHAPEEQSERELKAVAGSIFRRTIAGALASLARPFL